MIQYVGMKQRLLDHGQVELIHLLEQGQIVQRITGIAVNMAGYAGESGPDRAQHFPIPALSDFQFHPRIAGFDGLIDQFEQGVD